MNQGIYPLAATMINQLSRVDTLSNNLANTNTNGFKQDNLIEGSFNNYLKQAQEKDLEVTRLGQVANTIPKIDKSYISEDLGAITPTNNQLDFAIKDKNMFFKVQDPKSGEIFLTRNGSFNIMENKLVTQNGFQVLNIDNDPIIAEDNFAQQISLVKTPFENLEKQGLNNYKIKLPNQTEEIASNDEYVLQGAIERSNVNTITTMVALIDTHRRLEQAQKAMTGIDQINQKLIDKIGSGR